MDKIVYVNGHWTPEAEAHVSVLDRSVLFSDAVYEVVAVEGNQLLDFDGHISRLINSLKKLDIHYKVDRDVWHQLFHEIRERNNLTQGYIYLQISRGVAQRSFVYNDNLTPSVMLLCGTNNITAPQSSLPPLKLLSKIDGRWARRDIKTTQLVYASQAKTWALSQGADDVVFVEDNHVTEVSAANIFILNAKHELVTHPTNESILAGITRARFIKNALEEGLIVKEQPFTLQEAYQAQEVFITSASQIGLAVGSIDGKIIADGRWGPITQRLRQLYFDTVTRS